jgi:hypothetical protein
VGRLARLNTRRAPADTLAGRVTSVLYLHGNAEDYLADSLLHGLRSVLGAEVVDVPRRDSLYAVEDPARVYGRGFTLYGTLPDIPVWRGWAIDRALRGEFDVIVFADIWRYWGPWAQLRSRLFELKRRNVTLVAVDGHDSEAMYPHGPAYWKGIRPWPPQRAHGRIAFFKRELTPWTARLRYYGLLPVAVAERRLARHVQPIAFSIPEEKLATGEEPKTKLLATHVVDPEVQALVPGTATSYAFEDEAEYVADLRASRFGITTKRAGWDCMRHYEQAAAGCVPCFRDLDRKPATCAPHGLDETNCVPYRDPRALLARIEAMGEDEYAALRRGALAWARENTTRVRATQFLRAVGR